MLRPDYMQGMTEEEFFSQIENGGSPTTVSPEKGEPESPESEKNIIPNERVAFTLFPFFIEMIDYFTDTLKALGAQTRILPEKLGAKEFAAYLNQMIMEDIQKTELLKNSLYHYIKINNPIIRSNTVNTLIEEELKKFQGVLEKKKVKLFRTLEKDLPEIAVPDDQLRYILNCLLQHVVTLMPQNRYFGLLSRSFTPPKEMVEGQALRKKEEKSIEILIVYANYKKPAEPFGTGLATPLRPKEEVLDLALRLVDEIVQRNRGIMRIEADEKRVKTTISLRFPLERRRVVCSQLAAELNPNMNPVKTTFERLSSLDEMKNKE